MNPDDERIALRRVIHPVDVARIADPRWTRYCISHKIGTRETHYGWRHPGEPDAGADETTTVTRGGIEHEVRAPGGTRLTLIPWPRVIALVRAGATPARLRALHAALDGWSGRAEREACNAILDAPRDEQLTLT